MEVAKERRRVLGRGDRRKCAEPAQQMSTRVIFFQKFTLTSSPFMFCRSNALRRQFVGRRWLIAVVPTASLGLNQRQYASQPALIPARASEPVIVPRLTVVGRVWEYVLTAKRFIYLCFLFIPVLISSPMILVGKNLRGDRWGAIWWYGLLVSRMEAAGPTFIKVF